MVRISTPREMRKGQAQAWQGRGDAGRGVLMPDTRMRPCSELPDDDKTVHTP